MKKLLPVLLALLLCAPISAQQGIVFPGRFTLFDNSGASPSFCQRAQAGIEFCLFAHSLGSSVVLEANDGGDVVLSLENPGAGNFNLGVDGGVLSSFLSIDAASCLDVSGGRFYEDEDCNEAKGATERYLIGNSHVRFKGINLDPNHATTDWFFYWSEGAATVTRVRCIADAGTVDLTVNECDSDGGTCSAIEAAITCGTTMTTTTAIDNASLDDGDMVRVSVGTVTGSPTQALYQVFFEVAD